MQVRRCSIGLSWIFGFILVSPSTTARSPDAHARATKAFVDFVQKQMRIDGIPGLSAGFYMDGSSWVRGFGYADLENKIPAQEKTSYRLASNTKSMTAAAILQLAEKGKIDLDADIRTYVPYFPRKKWPFTARQLLGHLAGISHYRDYDLEGHIKVDKDTRESLKVFDEFELVAEPGTRFIYTSYGYNLLGAIVESVAKQPFGEYLRENLWMPLDMQDTHMDSPSQLIPNRVRGYRLVYGELENSEYVNMSSRFAAGGTRSTVVDLLKYARGLQNPKVLSQKSIHLMETSLVTRDGSLTDYGMGWQVFPVNGRFVAMHTGSQQETRTILIRLPAYKTAMAIAYNFEGSDIRKYAYRLYQLLFDERWNQPVYTGSREYSAIYQALWEVFNYGMGHYQQHGKPLCKDSGKLKAAFDTFRSSVRLEPLRASFQKAKQRIEAGRHPMADQAFVKVGSYMAMRLENKKKNYHQHGAIPFFYDYLALYKKDQSIPSAFRFASAFEKIIVNWQKAWRKTWNDRIRRIHITAGSDLNQIDSLMKKQFSKVAIYPDFTQDIARAVEDLYLTGQIDRAISTAQMAHQIYPESALLLVMLANAYVVAGQPKRAERNYLKAQKAKIKSGAVEGIELTRYAGRMAGAKRIESAMKLLKIAERLYPKNALIQERMADLYLQKSRAHYKRALQLDPTIESSWKRLKRIE